MTDKPYRPSADGLTLSVRLTPKGGRDGVDGVDRLSDGTCVLAVRVRALAQDSAANKALSKVIADALDVAASRVSLLKGATGRVKTLMVKGDSSLLLQRAASLCAGVLLAVLMLADASAQGMPPLGEMNPLQRSLALGPMDVCISRVTFQRTRSMVYRTGKQGPDRSRRLRVLRVGEDLAETGCGKRDVFLVRRATGMVNSVNREVGLPPIDLPSFASE